MEEKVIKIYRDILEKIDKSERDDLTKLVKSWSKVSKDMVFCFYLIVCIESILKKVLEDLLLNSQKLEKKYPEFVESIFDETTFNSKINIMEKMFKKSKRYKDFKSFFSYCREINNLRNKIFHNKVKDIRYQGLLISDITTKRKMLKDLIKARIKMNI